MVPSCFPSSHGSLARGALRSIQLLDLYRHRSIADGTLAGSGVLAYGRRLIRGFGSRINVCHDPHPYFLQCSAQPTRFRSPVSGWIDSVLGVDPVPPWSAVGLAPCSWTCRDHSAHAQNDNPTLLVSLPGWCDRPTGVASPRPDSRLDSCRVMLESRVLLEGVAGTLGYCELLGS